MVWWRLITDAPTTTLFALTVVEKEKKCRWDEFRDPGTYFVAEPAAIMSRVVPSIGSRFGVGMSACVHTSSLAKAVSVLRERFVGLTRIWFHSCLLRLCRTNIFWESVALSLVGVWSSRPSRGFRTHMHYIVVLLATTITTTVALLLLARCLSGHCLSARLLSTDCIPRPMLYMHHGLSH